ncbi:hypothetical protein ACTMTF_27075 [Nonomuraea sp. ZG12]|uniref:hypothetical protein n=1 Tax=Nonomuraea sp. ZG12 TaxID=3452207 RepID=UPI003F8A3F9E
MDGESAAAAALLAALSRATGILAELRHPFARSRHFSYFFPPAGARTGTAFVLPDGRELSFEVSIAVSGDAFHIDGSVTVEGEVLLELPRRRTSGVHEGLAVLEEYAAEVAQPAGRLLDQLLDEIV